MKIYLFVRQKINVIYQHFYVIIILLHILVALRLSKQKFVLIKPKKMN